MEELIELKQFLQSGEIDNALALAEELEEMGKKGIARNIRSFAKVLLLHLIKQQVEQRTTKSWSASIRNAIREIEDINARPKNKGFYLTEEEVKEIIASAWDSAVDSAAIESCEGIYNFRQIEQMIDKDEIIAKAFLMLSTD